MSATANDDMQCVAVAVALALAVRVCVSVPLPLRREAAREQPCVHSVRHTVTGTAAHALLALWHQ